MTRPRHLRVVDQQADLSRPTAARDDNPERFAFLRGSVPPWWVLFCTEIRKPPSRRRLLRFWAELLLGGGFGRGSLGLGRLALAILAVEPLDAAGRIHQLLLAGK